MPDAHSGLKAVPGLDALGRDHGRLFVVVGVFDGLHRGHLYLLDHLRTGAAQRGARPAVITFDHHPDEILTGSAPPLLCDPDERLARLAGAGVEVTVVEHFDQVLRMTEFDTFIRKVADRVELGGFLMTPDAAFGHERKGTPEAVAALGSAMGFDVLVVAPLDLDGRAVRSTDIRAAIAAGNLGLAGRLLGRPYAVVGEGSLEPNTDLRFAMPVALPPPGEYGVQVARLDESIGLGITGQSGRAVIDLQGRVRLRGLAPVEAGRVRLTFN